MLLGMLKGQTILVTRAAKQSSDFLDRLQAAEAIAISMPALEIGPPSSWQVLDTALDRLSEFHWLILTSANGVNFFCDRLLERGQTLAELENLKIAVVGKKTEKVLRKRGLTADFIPPNFVADALVETFPEPVAGQQILFPRVETGGRDVLVKELTEKGAIVVEAPAYESRCPQAIAPEALVALQENRVDIVTFASSKTVKNFVRLVQEAGNIDLQKLRVASIGPQTSQACRQYFDRVDIEASEYTLDGLFEALAIAT